MTYDFMMRFTIVWLLCSPLQVALAEVMLVLPWSSPCGSLIDFPSSDICKMTLFPPPREAW